MDPYSAYFEPDHMSSSHFARLYGLNRWVPLTILGVGLKEAKDPKNYSAPKIPKPVLWLKEHEQLPLYTNKTQFGVLVRRFGEGYWLNGEEDRIFYALIKVRAIQKRIGGEDTAVVEFLEGDYGDHRRPLGDELAAKIKAAIPGFSFDMLRIYVQQEHRHALNVLDSTENLADLPHYFGRIIAGLRKERESDLTPKNQAPTHTPESSTPSSGPSSPSKTPPQDEPNFKPNGGHNTSTTITADDIPF